MDGAVLRDPADLGVRSDRGDRGEGDPGEHRGKHRRVPGELAAPGLDSDPGLRDQWREVEFRSGVDLPLRGIRDGVDAVEDRSVRRRTLRGGRGEGFQRPEVPVRPSPGLGRNLSERVVPEFDDYADGPVGSRPGPKF